MATIKSYTDLEQSRKLAEILPLESADMCYEKGMGIGGSDIVQFGNAADIWITENMLKIKTIPCWSLAALLEALKNKIVYGGNDSENWFVSYTKKNPTKTIFIYKEHLIDACYEAILNLNKEGLL